MSTNITQVLTRANLTEEKEIIIGHHILGILTIIGTGGINLMICIVGIFTNSLNLFTFAKLGVEDNVILCFFVLSIYDLCGLIVMMVAITTNYVHYFHGNVFSINLIDVIFVISQYFRLFYALSIATTTYIALQRGCCVALPFYFKGVFTRNRSLLVLGIILALIFSCSLPPLLKTEFSPLRNSKTKTTTLVLDLKEGWVEAQAVNEMVNKVILVFASQILVIMCLIVIVVGMRSSSKFRASFPKTEMDKPSKIEKLKKLRGNFQERTSNLDLDPTQRGMYEDKPQQHQRGDQRLISRKETRVVRQVTLVSTVFVICTLPQTLTSIASRVVPEFNMNQRYNNLFWVIYNIVNCFEFINASVNFFIYYKFNLKFRDIIISHFKCKKVN